MLYDENLISAQNDYSIRTWPHDCEPITRSTAQSWMGLQSQYDLDVAEDQLDRRLDREVHTLASAR